MVTELAGYKLDLMGMQEVRCDKRGTARVGDCTFFCGKANENRESGAGYFVLILYQQLRE